MADTESLRPAFNLSEYAVILWRRKWLVAAVTVVTVGSVLAASLFLMTPTYRSSSEMLVENSGALQALFGTAVPVARPLALCTDPAVIGSMFYVMEHVDGRVFWDPGLPGLAPAERRAVFDGMGAAIAAMHTLDWQARGLADYGRPGSYLTRQVARWTRQYRASETEPIPAMDRLIDWLPAHLPARETTALVHGDYRLDNLIFHPTEPRIVAVLDWELSTLGDPLADFSYHCMSWHIPPGQFRGIAGLDLAALGIPTEADYIRRYCERTGRRGIEHWDFYLAYNLFRIAAILQGVYKRATEGIASSDNALEAGKRARGLAELGWQAALRAT